MSTENKTEVLLSITEAERVQLVRLLEQTVRDVHSEARRTESPGYRDEIHHHEEVLRGLLAKVRDRHEA